MELLKKYWFRGKVADEPNEWVYGYLMNDKTIYQPQPTKWSNCCGTGMFSVHTNTVGLYTRLIDKDGLFVFEGDIIKEIDTEHFYKIVFNGMEFLAVDESNNEPYLLSSFNSDEIQVIGNEYEV